MFGKRFTMTISLFICVCILANLVYAAKSVFIISVQDNSKVQAYRINGNSVTLQITATLPHIHPDSGPIALAVWPQKELMFVTYDNSPIIRWVSTKTLEQVSEFNTGVTSVLGLGGIAVDTTNRKIYVVQRRTTNLYHYCPINF